MWAGSRDSQSAVCLEVVVVCSADSTVTEGDDQIYDKLPRNNNSVADSLVRPNGKHIYPLNFGCTCQCDTLRRYLVNVSLINGRSISRERWRFISRRIQLRGLSGHGRDTPELGGRGGRGGRAPLWKRSNFKTAWVSGQRDWATGGGERSRSVSCKPGGEQRVPAPHHPETGVIQVNLAHSKQLEQGKSDNVKTSEHFSWFQTQTNSHQSHLAFDQRQSWFNCSVSTVTVRAISLAAWLMLSFSEELSPVILQDDLDYLIKWNTTIL